jgi:alkylhydroperoxidase/carboxymuconolactone decarboxylase family protein YurZ
MRETDAWAATLDPNFFDLWAAFSGGLEQRGKLDERTRLLVAIGQCVSTGEIDEMSGFVREALSKATDPREVLEVILQAAIYVGKPKTNRAGLAFIDVARGMGVLEQLGPPPSFPHLDLDEQRARWRVPDAEFPRREELMHKYGWQGIGAGLRTQPWHHARSVEFIDSVDEEFTRVWLDFIYAGMYSREVLDDKTRTITMVGDTVAVEELEQAENHMRNALILGASREELLEVCLQSTQFVGMPRSFKAIRILLRITAEDHTTR